MTISIRSPVDVSGNQIAVDGVTLTWDAMTNVSTPPATQVSVCAGTGAPTFSAKQGTLYINLTGSTGITRMYVNTTGSTTWTAVNTVA